MQFDLDTILSRKIAVKILRYARFKDFDWLKIYD